MEEYQNRQEDEGCGGIRIDIRLAFNDILEFLVGIEMKTALISLIIEELSVVIIALFKN